MHEHLLRQAMIPAPAYILGLPMKPYSIGHELLLQTEPDSVSFEQAIATACLICANSWRENQSIRHDLLMPLKLWGWKRRVRKLDAAVETEKFAAYRANGSREFPLSTREDPNREPRPAPGTPFLLHLQQFIMFRFRLKDYEAWDHPYGAAKMHWIGYWEQEGGLRVKNANEVEFEQFIAEQEAERKKEREKQCQAS